jgi:NADH:ubiquinone oxidoreductase subunit F (NADH-binding)/(2Fe-2S) ferredoxin
MEDRLTVLQSLPELIKLRRDLNRKREQSKSYLAVCGDTGCNAWGSEQIKDLFQLCLEQKGLSQRVGLKFTGCLGLCECGPVVIVFPQGIFYQKVRLSDIEEIVDQTLLEGKIIDRLLYQDPVSGEKIADARRIPFYHRQDRVLLAEHWNIDPSRVEDYLSLGGYGALGLVLEKMSAARVIEVITDARLRGRGGAGFPTGLKWRECKETAAAQKYIICNADEGDPGAFMDRSLLEGNPHSVLEGLIIGGYAVGASEGIIYIRAEYPTALQKIRRAISQAEALGLLGENILGSGFNFQVGVSVGAGAFVCGETSALVASVQGRVGEPRQKPPHLAERGYNNCPTVINNVETLANVPRVINAGAEAYRLTGTARSGGTKIFSLVGKVNHTGLVEVPLGTSLREIIFSIGGGIKGGRSFKAVQTGGPSGGCLPASMLDLPTDFEELSAAGSMIGSGGMIVMDEESCMVDLARYFLKFLSEESCGRCFTCREGIARMLEMVESIGRGQSSMEEFELLKELAVVVKNSTMCGLGQTAANPVLSTMRYFAEEYRIHIEEARCPAGVCRDLIRFHIDADLCNGCTACRRQCPADAIEGEAGAPHLIRAEHCTRCGICLEICRYNAVTKL